MDWMDRMDGGVVGIAGSAAMGAGGPTPDAVGVVAQRLLDIALEVESIRLGMGAVGAPGWQSPAAGAFRERLAAGTAAVSGAEQDVRAAALAVMALVRCLESAVAPAGPATNLLSKVPPRPALGGLLPTGD